MEDNTLVLKGPMYCTTGETMDILLKIVDYLIKKHVNLTI